MMLADIQQELGLRDIFFQVVIHLRGMWRHRWHMIFTAWFICLAGWVSVAAMDDQYVARGQVMIDDPRKDISKFLTTESSLVDVTREARRILNLLLSRENLLTVIRETDLAFRVTNDGEKEDVLQALRAQLAVEDSGNNVYRITHRHNEANLTRQVVEVLLRLLPVNSVQKVTGGSARSAQGFLQKQVADYEKKVVDAERELRKFQADNSLALPGEGGGGGYYVRVQQIEQQVNKDTLHLKELMERREEVHRQLEELESRRVSPTDAIDQKIDELKAKLAELSRKTYTKGNKELALYPESHYEVRAIRKSIEYLEQQREEKKQRLKSTADDPDLWAFEADPVYRRLKVAASKVDEDIASANALLEDSKGKLRKLKSLESTIPVLENNLVRLQSYLSLAKGKMVSMLNQEGIARFSGELEEDLSQFIRFKVVERPSTPTRPVGPNRTLFSTVVLVGGLLAGLAISLFFAVIRPVFDSPGSLKKILGLPVLGMVSMTDAGLGRQWVHSSLAFALVILSLLGTFAVVVYWAPNF